MAMLTTKTKQEDTHMANRNEFLNELDAQTSGLQQGLQQITQTIGANELALQQKREARTSRIHDLAEKLLPDLESATLARAETQFPDSVSQKMVALTLLRNKSGYQKQISELRVRFNPDEYTSNIERLTVAMEVVKTDLNLVKEPFENLKNIPHIERLISAGYETKDYVPRWYNIQFYTDWRDADLAMAKANVADWAALVDQYETQSSGVATLNQSLAMLEKEMSELKADMKSYTDLKTALENVTQGVLDQLRVKLAAYLDTRDEPGDAQIRDLQQENATHQATRLEMTSHLASMQRARAQVVKSKAKTIPDSYIQDLRATRYSGSRSGSSSNSNFGSAGYNSPVYVNQGSDRFFEGMYFGQMLDYFAHPVHETVVVHDYRSSSDTTNSGGYDSSTRSQMLDDARNDRSGQS